MTQRGYQLMLPLEKCQHGTTDASQTSAETTTFSEQPSKPSRDRLFVPLSKKPYQWFASGEKRWELRKRARQYTENQVRSGRSVELRLGYNGSCKSIWGRIVDIYVASSITEFFNAVDWRQVIPESQNRQEAESCARRILRLEHDAEHDVIGFKIAIETSDAFASQK